MSDLTYEIVSQKFVQIGEILPGAPATPEAFKLFFDAIKHLTEYRFHQVCESMVAELEFFPKPAWIRQKAIELAHGDSAERKPLALPFAEPESGISACPAYVRKWMQAHYSHGKELFADLKAARTRAKKRMVGSKSLNLSTAILVQIESDSEVVAAKAAIGKHWISRKEAAHQMEQIKESMSPEEEEEFSYEWSFAGIDFPAGGSTVDDAEDF
jgi:hypothetical protein